MRRRPRAVGRVVSDNNREHIGVYNVAARLGLLGKEYGVDIRSRQGEGTAAVLRLPRVLADEEEGGRDD